jgi:hypothetical protein
MKQKLLKYVANEICGPSDYKYNETWHLIKLYVMEKQQLGKHLMHYVRFEVFTAVTMKNVIFWDIKTQFVLQRRRITSPLQSPAS